jgi:hypothetical protein
VWGLVQPQRHYFTLIACGGLFGGGAVCLSPVRRIDVRASCRRRNAIVAEAAEEQHSTPR